VNTRRTCGRRTQRRANRSLGAGVVGLIAGLAAVAGPAVSVAMAATETYTTPGSYTYTVPAGVNLVALTAAGGAGGACGGTAGGEAGSVGGTFAVAGGEVLSVQVAGPGAACSTINDVAAGGSGGGGAGGADSAGGGGASAVGVPATSTYLLVAAGGGGSSGNGTAGDSAAGGNAGANGADGIGTGGSAGSTTSGGAGGIDVFDDFAYDGNAGGSLSGGAGGSGGVIDGPVEVGGGGGGSGLFGGGGGAGSVFMGGGGGGGASVIDESATDPSGLGVTTAPAGVTIATFGPTADLSGTSLSLGSEAVGSIGAEQTITLSNNGNQPLTVSGVQAGGTNPGDYLVSDRCQEQVAPGGSCQIGVRFAPQAVGASSATLTLLTNTGSAAAVSLSGSGTAPATAATGPQGAAGPPGPAGATGPAGPAGTIVCRNTLAAQALCTLEFAPGTFSTEGAIKHASFVIERSGHTIESGTLTTRPGKVSRLPVGKLSRGHYTLIITTGHGHGRKVLLRYLFEVR